LSRYEIQSFLDIANTLPADFEHNSKLTSAKDDLIKQLQDENQKLKWENDLLKEIIVKKDKKRYFCSFINQ